MPDPRRAAADVVHAVERWRAAGNRIALARVVELTGFGGRRADELLAVNEHGDHAGDLLNGSATAESAALAAELLADHGNRLDLKIDLGDRDAVAAGLACGGTATVRVETLESAPSDVLASLGVTPHVGVIGAADLAQAIARQAALLGWDASVADGLEAAVELTTGLGSTDAVVVLSHDPDVDTPTLAAALRGGVGFVGALGSRHTQAARRDRLAAAGFAEADLARIHGPVGLDLGARTPEETAVAIVAEIIASRSGRTARELRATEGPINP